MSGFRPKVSQEIRFSKAIFAVHSGVPGMGKPGVAGLAHICVRWAVGPVFPFPTMPGHQDEVMHASSSIQTSSESARQ